MRPCQSHPAPVLSTTALLLLCALSSLPQGAESFPLGIIAPAATTAAAQLGLALQPLAALPNQGRRDDSHGHGEGSSLFSGRSRRPSPPSACWVPFPPLGGGRTTSSRGRADDSPSVGGVGGQGQQLQQQQRRRARMRRYSTRLHSSLSTRGGGGGGGSGLTRARTLTRPATGGGGVTVVGARRAAMVALVAAAWIDAAVTRKVVPTLGAAVIRVLRPVFSVPFWSAAAPFASIALKLSPMPTILGVRKRGSTGGLPLLPYTAMASLTFVLVVYGILVRDPKIAITHSIGHLLSLFYFTTFLRNCDPASTSLPGTPRLHKTSCLSIASVAILSAAVLGRSAAPLVGYSSATLSMIMYAGPLSAARRAMAARSAESIPLPYAVASFFNSVAWTVYGYFGRNNDVAVWVPGLVGLLSAGAQIGLNVAYGNGPTSDSVLGRGGERLSTKLA